MSSDLIVDIGNGGVLPQCLFLAIVRYFMSYTASQFCLELTDAQTQPGLTLLVPLEDFEPHRI